MWRFLPALLLLLAPHQGRPSQSIDPEWYHLRNAEPREWSRFPAEADAKQLEVRFDLADPDSFRLLTWRQEDTKQVWEIHLNGEKLGNLLRDHNHLEHGIAIPDGILKASGNQLEVSCKSETPDDIRIGDFALHTEVQALASEERNEELFQQRGFRRALPPMTASITLSARELPAGTPVPCRFTVIDAESGALALIGAESDDRLAIREGVIYSIDGQATFRLAGSADAPRRYRIFCGRGFEYGLAQEEIVIDRIDEVSLEFGIRREVPTPGLVACDPHLHSFQFDRHGDCSLAERLISLAGEGVELPISTAHDRHVDYEEAAERVGADRWFTPILGCEVTTSLGHFNSFPIETGAQPAEHKLRPWSQIFRNIFTTPGVQVCMLNHPRDVHRGFRPLAEENFDRDTGLFRQGWKLEANAMELINSGAQQTDPMELVLDWFALLQSGHRIAGMGTSDSHTVNFAIPGQGRTYLELPDDDPGNLDAGMAIDSILSGRTHVSFGLLTRLEVERDLVSVRVLGPSWSEATVVRLFRNGEEIRSVAVPESARDDPGEKLLVGFTLKSLELEPGDLLCAVATGPGITEAWWPIMPPYQPDGPDFEPFVMGISPALRLE